MPRSCGKPAFRCAQVEFGIWKTNKGIYKAYNMTAPGGDPGMLGISTADSPGKQQTIDSCPQRCEPWSDQHSSDNSSQRRTRCPAYPVDWPGTDM